MMIDSIIPNYDRVDRAPSFIRLQNFEGRQDS